MADRARQDHSGEHGRDVRADRAREVGLFRYALIRAAADPALSTRQRGRLVRDLAAREHAGPFGERVRVSRVTIDRWILVWRRGGFDALLPSARSAQPRTAAAVLELAAALKREVPARTAAQVRAILLASAGAAPSQRTLQRHFVRLELNTRPDGLPPRAFGRFEAAAPNERWTGDALHGPVVAGRKTYLFAFIDDHSRALVGYRWGHSEDTVRLEAALRAGLASRGVPQRGLSRQRLRDGLLAAAAGPGDPGDHAHPQQTRPTRRPGQDRKVLPDRPGAVPRRARRPGSPRRGRGPRSAQRVVRRLGRDRLPRDGCTARPVRGRWNGSWPPAHRPCRPRRCCTRRSCGRSAGR